MPYRGRLIWPFRATIARLDTAATAANTAGGTFSEGYDHLFNEPNVVAGDDGAPDTNTRLESLIEGLPCQVHTERGGDNFAKLAQMLGGTVMRYEFILLFHYVNLEALGLVETDGSALLKVNDRLVGLYTSTGALVRDFTTAPVYAIEVQDRSFGLSGGQRNLLAIKFKNRDTSVMTG